MADHDNQIQNVALSGSGQAQTIQMESGVPVKFDFDLSEAVFSSSGDDLVITVENGGSVILEDYLTMAEEGSLPTFEMVNGEQVPGDVYMFAFNADGATTEEPLETAAEGQAGGSGAGAYSDAPGSLGDRLDALGGQEDSYAERAARTIEAVTGEEEVGENGEIIYPEDEEVQIVLNSSFESYGRPSGGWDPTNDMDHWKNPNGTMEVWEGDRMRTDSFHGDKHMELDSARGEDQLSQAIAVQAGEEVNIGFAFAARNHGRFVRPEECDLDVMLGDQLVGRVQWNPEATYDFGEGEVVTGAYEVLVPGEDGELVVQETFPHQPGQWFELDFTTTATADHAELTFVEHADTNTTYGAMIDDVTATRNFHQVLQGGEGAENLIGSEGDDAIFGTTRDVVDGETREDSGGDFLYGGGGDDAIYGSNGYDLIAGGDGDDFIVTGRGISDIIAGGGDDYVRLSGGESGEDWILVDRSVLQDGSTMTVENFEAGGEGRGSSDWVFLGEGVSLVGDPVDDGHGNLVLTVGATDGSGDTMSIKLLGVDNTEFSEFIENGNPYGEDLADVIQDVIDSGEGNTGGGLA